VSLDTNQLAEAIIDWEAGRKEYYEEEFEHFTYRLESVDEEIEIDGHTLKFVDWVLEVSEASLFVFTVDGELYALRGAVSSWGNSWDRGIFKVQPKTVVLETYEVI
jgi:hypothetical protein